MVLGHRWLDSPTLRRGSSDIAFGSTIVTSSGPCCRRARAVPPGGNIRRMDLANMHKLYIGYCTNDVA